MFFRKLITNGSKQGRSYSDFSVSTYIILITKKKKNKTNFFNQTILRIQIYGRLTANRVIESAS